MAKKDVNRLKIMLAVTKHSNKWLAEMLGKDQATISKWCTNTCQPDLETLIRISDLLKVDVNDLLNKECIKEWWTIYRNRYRKALIRLRAYLPIWHLQLESRGPSVSYRLYVWRKLQVDLWQLILPFYNKGKQKLVYSLYF